MNRFAAALSQHPLPAHAVGEVAGQILDQLEGDDPDLVVCFASPHVVGALDDVIHALNSLLTPHVMIGTTASGVIAGTHEVEEGVGFAAFAACLGLCPPTPDPRSDGSRNCRRRNHRVNERFAANAIPLRRGHGRIRQVACQFWSRRG